MPKCTMVLLNDQLIYYDNFGFCHEYDITSGRSGERDPRVRDRGPIPAGKYKMKIEDIAGGWLFCLYWRLYKEEDWGVYRVPLKPEEDTDTFDRDRDSFSLHGGLTPGSAGCIDVGTPNDLLLFALLKLSFQDEIMLEVIYPQTGNFDITYA